MNRTDHKILYVEDNPVNRVLVRRVLTKAGYRVLEADDGLSGIRIAEQERPDLILMDLMLPGLDGHQVTTRLKTLPDLAETPIIALTAKVMPGDRERALVAGCDGYIPKPVDVDQLPVQIAEFLTGKREEIKGGPEEQLTLQREYTRDLVIQLERKVRELEMANAELRRTDELKSKFISMASHELKTPLAVIHGYLCVFKTHVADLEDEMNEPARVSLAGMEKGVARLRSIIEDMLAVVKIESETLAVHLEPLPISDLLLAVAHKLEPAAVERRLTIRLDPMDSLPIIRADAQLMQQVFFNLLSNAIKFTPDGGLIHISAQVTHGIQLMHRGRPTSASGAFLHIVFYDTGIGIDREDQERIFDLFYEVRDISLHSTSKTRFLGSGLGLGLAIARGIVEAHGGFLWAESEGHDREACPGSTFHVLLPLDS
jgi:signal transduction histidine kinase